MTGDGLGRGLSDMWRSVLLFLPKGLAFLAILIIGYVLARLARTVVAKSLHRVGFDRAVDKGAVGRTLRGSNITASDLCAKVAFYAVLLFALQLAFGIWGQNAVSDLLTSVIAWLPRAFVAIVIIVVASAIGGAAHDLIVSALGGLTYGRLLARAASILIITLGVIAALDQVRIATAVTQPVLIAVLATVAGVIIVGVGGGLIRPMQRRWEDWLAKAGAESAVIREQARAYTEEKTRAAKAAEEARRAEEARKAEEARRAEEARKAEEARAAEARRVEEERKADEARKAEEARKADEVRKAEDARKAEEARAAAAARTAEEEAARQRALEAAAAEETQVIPVREAQRSRLTDTAVDLPPVDDRPHLIPGFDREDEHDTAEVPTSGAPTAENERTQVLSGADDTVVVPRSDDTQVLPPAGATAVDDTTVLPGDGPTEPEPPRRGPGRKRR